MITFNSPLCSLSDTLLIALISTGNLSPSRVEIPVKNVKISAGAGFIVVLTGDIMTMPGLPKHPAAERIDIDENGIISGLF